MAPSGRQSLLVTNLVPSGSSVWLGHRRGWAGGFLSGAWDGGDTGAASRDYPAAGLRASWAITQLGDLSCDIAVDLCSTGQAWFSPLGDAVMTPVPLASVPAEVFSEAMRDLDLVVSVTTVANDPAWFEEHRGEPVIRSPTWACPTSGPASAARPVPRAAHEPPPGGVTGGGRPRGRRGTARRRRPLHRPRGRTTAPLLPGLRPAGTGTS